MVAAKKEKLHKSEPSVVEGPAKQSISVAMEKAPEKVNPATVRWTGIKQTMLTALLKVNATSPVTGLTQEELAKATKLDLAQVRHQLNQKFYLFTTGAVKLAKVETNDGRPKNVYYLTKSGVKLATSFE